MNAHGLARLSRPSVAAAAFVLALLLPQLLGLGDSDVQKLNEIAAFVVLGIALNIAAGFAGQFLLGLSGVFAIAGYAAVYVVNKHPSFGFLGMIISGVVAASLAGAIIGLPTLRVGGFYLGVVTLFVAVLVPTIAQHVEWLGGATGIALFANLGYEPQLDARDQYLLFGGIILLMTLLSWAVLHSRLGRRFQLIAASEELSASLGIPSYRTKMVAVMLSSAVAGVGGAIYVYGQQFFAPGSADVNLSVLALAAVVVGGMGRVSGPLVGCALVFGLNTFLSFASYTGIVFGALLLAFVLVARRGVMHALTQVADLLRMPRLTRTFPVALDGSGSKNGAAPDGAVLARESQPRELAVSWAKRAFGQVRAVDGVSVTLATGELHGLIGSNGSGKTTLLNLISGFYALDAGRITAGTVNLTRRPAFARARAGIARTFQTPKLLDHNTVFENVLVGAEAAAPVSHVASVLRLPPGRRARAAAEQRAYLAMSVLGLLNHAGTEVEQLPHGTRRLVELARVIAFEPRFVLVDEPAAGLSEAEVAVLSDCLVGMTRKGAGVLLIEHNVPLVLSMAGKVTALHEGKPLFQGTPQELRSDPDVATAFLGSSTGAENVEVIARELI